MAILQSKLTTANGVDVSASNPLPVSATLNVGDIEIGAVELKNGTDDTRAVVGAGTGITEAGNALGVKDPTIGLKADAAVQDASSSASLVSLLKGLQAIVGLVTVSPTANTVLDRLKTINTSLLAATPAGTNVIGHVIRDAVALTTVTHSVGTAGLTTTTALAANASRRYALIVNDSANIVYLKLGATAVLNTGIRLNANGGSYEINEINLYTGIIDCITTVAAQTLLVTEGV